MRLVSIEFTKRWDGYHHFRDLEIPAIKPANGVGALAIFEASPIDADFRRALRPREIGVWPYSTKEVDRLLWSLDESDHRTAELLKVSGWDSGPRPFRLEQFV